MSSQVQESALALEWSGKTKASGLVLILYTWLLTFAPSEAYLVPYLTRVKPFSPKQVSIDIFPYGIYATFFFTLLAAPICHYYTHRAVIIIGTFGKLVTFVILYYGESLFIMQLSQITYGAGMASNLVFSSYIFILFSEQDYQAMTSYTQASSLASFLVAAELGQFLVNGGVSLVVLLQITLIFAVLSCIVSFLLPNEVSESHEIKLLRVGERGALQGVWEVIRETWQGGNLRLLSFWWVFGTAGFAMVLNYGLNLFDEIDPSNNTYGHIIAASQGAGSLGALAGVHLAPSAAQKGGSVYVLGTFATGLLCIILGWSNTLWVAYPTYVAAIGINQLLLCLIYVQCAKCISNREFILLFSLNAAAALLIQSAMQVGIEYLQLLMGHQFYVYGGYCIALAIVFWFLCHENYLKTGTVELVPSSETDSTSTLLQDFLLWLPPVACILIYLVADTIFSYLGHHMWPRIWQILQLANNAAILARIRIDLQD